MTSRYLGIDVGGTNSKLAVVEAGPGRPALLATATIPTGTGDPGEVVGRLAAAGARLVAGHGPAVAAGVGVPGLFDEASGRIVLLPNLPAAWTGQAFREPLAAGLGVPVALINDARAFTLAESRMGAAAGCPTVVCLTLGTGVGGGVVVDGRLRFGPSGRAGELGHQVIEVDGPPCGCGNRGCVEAFAAGAALCRAGGRGEHRLRGVAAAGDQLFGPLRAAVAVAAPLVDPASYAIVPAALGPGAGAIGAALWAQERTGR